MSNSLNRRQFVAAASAAAAIAVPGAHARAGSRAIRAVAFDAFTLFDPRPAYQRAVEIFPGTGARFAELWRVRQFQYAWLRSLIGTYVDFREITLDALQFAAQSTGISLRAEERDALLQGFFELPAWPEAAASLTELRKAGVGCALLSNLTPAMLESSARKAGINTLFDDIISTDCARTYKPDPRAYRLGIDAFHQPHARIAFAASAAWDAAGAAAFGFPTIWLNRLEQPQEPLGQAPEAVGRTLTDLVNFVLRSPA